MERSFSLVAGAIAALAVAAAAAGAPALVINEFVASNHRGLEDGFDDRPDWIELHNPGAEAVDLAGWGLSDTEDAPRRWTFEEGTIEPGGFFVVFASGRDIQQPTDPHTNFSISSAGEPLLLTTPSGEVADFVPAIALPTDVSRGRHPDGADAWHYFAEPTPGAPNTTEAFDRLLAPPAFSHAAGFRTEAFDLHIEATEPDVTIIYTLDGSEPDPAAIGGRTYHIRQSYEMRPDTPPAGLLPRSVETRQHDGSPVRIEDRSPHPDSITGINTTWRPDADHYAPLSPSFKGTVVRARHVAPGAIPSETVTRTYFVTPQGRDRYQLPIAAITVPEDALFDYHNGIYVPGEDFDAWRAANPGSHAGLWTPANYFRRGQETEAAAHLEFLPAGEDAPALEQGIGLRLHGGGTRIQPMKSLRLYARNAYDETDAFAYPFFPGLRNKVHGRTPASFRRLILRNSGSDYHDTMIRDAFLQAAGKPLGLDQQAYAPAITFVNGEFWGIMNFRERIDRHFLARHHAIEPEEVVLMNNNARLKDGHVAHRHGYMALRQYITDNDMADPAHFAHTADQMDMDNFVRYNAFQIYINNTDWPGNNVDYWRKATPDRSPGAPPGHDGRWRWIVFDLDLAFHASGPDGIYDVSFDMIAMATEPGGFEWPNPDWATTKLRNLLANEGFRHAFINQLADQMNSIFHPARVDSIIDRFHSRIAPHIPEHKDRWRDSIRYTPDFMKEFGRDRPQWVRQHVLDNFDLPGTATVTLETPLPRQGALRVNTLTIDPALPGLPDPAAPYPWSGVYFQDVPIEIEAIPLPGYRFSHWEGPPAGKTSATVTITPTGDFTARAVFEPVEGNPWEGLPTPHRLRAEPYRLHEWPADAPAGSHPPAMIFRQGSIPDTLLEDPLDGVWTLPYNLTSRSRISGRGPEGFAFINTSNPQEEGGGYLGAADLLLDTTGLERATVRFTAGTVLPNSRKQAIRLQYALTPDGPFHDVPGEDGEPVEYRREPGPERSRTLGPVELPAKAMDREHLTLRWRYHYVEKGVSGPRAKLFVTNIHVQGEPVAQPSWTLY